jgi:hypothetical protein
VSDHLKFLIDGQWVAPVIPATLDVIDPPTEEAYTKNLDRLEGRRRPRRRCREGREYADWAIHGFLDVKGIVGYGA